VINIKKRNVTTSNKGWKTLGNLIAPLINKIFIARKMPKMRFYSSIYDFDVWKARRGDFYFST